VAVTDRVTFTCNGRVAEIDVEPGETLLSVLRERLGLTAVKDGCAPQGQCGCCTVLVDGDARVACVTAAARVAGRSVTTIEGLDDAVRARFARAFVATGGSQCGFCTPGIVMRAAAVRRPPLDKALAAHLCRCTGWRTVYEAIERAASTSATVGPAARDQVAASTRAALEGGIDQRVAVGVPLGGGGFADDCAPRDALVAVPLPPGSDAESVDAAGARWVVGETLEAARNAAGKVQGRRTTVDVAPPLPRLALPEGGVRLATSWVEPAYLEPDASWCEPGGRPASPLANGGAFGGKEHSLAPVAARELADRFGRVVRVVYAREDVVRLGPKRPPISATAVWRDGSVLIEGDSVRLVPGVHPVAYDLDVRTDWHAVDAAGPSVGPELRAFGVAEQAVLVEGALDAAGVDRTTLTDDDALLDTLVLTSSGARSGARVTFDDATGRLTGVAVRVAAGDPLDEVVLRSYVLGAVHMALGWVLTEAIAVDAETGQVHDLTIRSFGIVRARDMPPVDVTILDDPAPARARSSDAVFAATAAATWNALTRVEGVRPDTFPARETRASRLLRR
jgi:aerobic-type carbon monoxide dehydrogenase small subunit (CoxS/CutS family)